MPDVFLSVFLVALGFVFLGAEILIPSFGVLTAMSLGSFTGGVIIGFGVSSTLGYGLIYAIVILAPILGIVMVRKLPNTWIGKRIIVRAPERPEKPAVEGKDLSVYLGRKGVAGSFLRPSGVALIGGERLDVVTQGRMIDKDTPVEVVEVEGNRLVVKPVKENDISEENK